MEMLMEVSAQDAKIWGMAVEIRAEGVVIWGIGVEKRRIPDVFGNGPMG